MDRATADRRTSFNDDRRRVFARGEQEIAFVCECDDPGCRETVVLTPTEFDERRDTPPWLVVRHGHRAPAGSG